MKAIRERTEAGDRPGLDKDSKFKGIARHPLARAWLMRRLAEARKAGDIELTSKIKTRMTRLGMEVR